MNRTLKIGTGIAVGAAAVSAAAMIAVAAPATTGLSTDDPTPSSSSSAPQDGGHRGETPLTGDQADRATAAAKAEVPDGTVLRVETDAEGTYEAHVRRTDGTEVVVTMDSDFAVTGVEEFQGHGGRGGHSRGPGPGETPLTGDQADRATAAAKAEVPDGTVLRVETDAEGTYEAHVRRTDGTEVVVTMDSDFAVTGVEEFQGHGGRGGRGGHGDGGRDGDGSATDDDPSASASSAA